MFLRLFELSDVDSSVELGDADLAPDGDPPPVEILVVFFRMRPDVFQSPENGFGDGRGCRQMCPFCTESILISDVSQFDRVPLGRCVGEGSLHDRRLVLLSWVLDRPLFLCCYTILGLVTVKRRISCRALHET